MNRLGIPLACTLLLSATAARADFTYQETTQITGGSIVGMMKTVGVFSKAARQAGDPVVSTVTIKGSRMMRASKDSTEIIDLDAGTITTIDNVKKQYTTITFEQLRQQMDAAMARARAQQAKQQPQASTDPNVNLSFDIKVRNTGATKDVAGLGTKESILTMTVDATDQKSGQSGALAITNDMYLAPEIPGYEEVRDFEKRYAERLGVMMNGALNAQMMALMQQPSAGKGLADMVKEMSKLKGIPMLQVMRLGTTANGTPLPAASEGPLPAGPPPPTAGSVAKSAVMNSLPFGGFGHKKKEEPPPASDAANQPAAAVLIESNTQLTTFSRASVDSSQFNIPVGYKLVAPKQME